MIGPSSGTSREVAERDSRSTKKRTFEELDIDNFCEEICQSSDSAGGRKRYIQELETPSELVVSNQTIANTNALFSSFITGQQDDVVVADCSVARLEVLLVDGTNCTWTTVPDYEEQQQNLVVTSSASSSPSSSTSTEPRREHLHQENVRLLDETNYQTGSNYWESVNSDVTIPTLDTRHNNRNVNTSELTSNNQQQQQQRQLLQMQQHQQEQQYDDQETGNLSWLLDFKLDPFIEAADDKSVSSSSLKDNHYGHKTKLNGRAYGLSSCVSDVKRNYVNGNENGTGSHQDQSTGYTNSENRNFGITRYSGPKKPPFTYTELIEHALQERGELTVSAIYQWISEHFPYYKSNDDRWKNSVRHNLSINPHFRKGSKAPHGAGHLWAIANRGDTRPRQIITSTAGGTTSTTSQLFKNSAETHHSRRDGNTSQVMDEVEAATASITQQSSSEEETESTVNSVTLEHCAEQILSGIKKEVEVQYIVPMMVANEHDSNQSNHQTHTELHYPVKESDFLNPVSKEVLAEECGLISEGYLVTDLNPTSLGLNMVEPEIITPENLFGEELSFQFYELTSPSQIQST